MASSRATARHGAFDVVVVALAFLLLLVATPFFLVTAAADTAATTATGDPADDAGGDNRNMVLDCTMLCVTEAMGCANRCAGARPDEAPVCAAACVQADIGCLGGCGPPQAAQPAPGGSPAPPALTPPAE